MRLLIGSVAAAALVGCSTGPESVELRPLDPAPSFLRATSADVHGHGCAFTPEQYRGTARELVFARWSAVASFEANGRSWSDPASVIDGLGSGSVAEREALALALSVALNRAGVFGIYARLGEAQVTGGEFAGASATDLLARRAARSESAVAAFNRGFAACEASWFVSDDDADRDGVPAAEDCDDNDPSTGLVLYENDLNFDSGYFSPTEQKPTPWDWDGNGTIATAGGQQVNLGQAETWDNVVVMSLVSAHGTRTKCATESTCTETDRWRAGLLVRAAADSDQDEGFHGYRCAISRNEEHGCYDPGHFLQVAEFEDGPEDDILSECEANCPGNNTFDQLGRTDHGAFNINGGDQALLKFWAVGESLYCEASADGEVVTASGTSGSFPTGGVGFSTLNTFGDFEWIKVCEAYGLPGDPVDPPDPDECLEEGAASWAISGAPVDTAVYGGDGGHALWLPNFFGDGQTVRMSFGDDAIAARDADGTLVIDAIGTIYTGANRGQQWTFHLEGASRGVGAAGQGPGGPKLELADGAQPTSITDGWEYFDVTDAWLDEVDGSGFASLEGMSDWPLQLGDSASGKNLAFGLSTWFTYDVWMGGQRVAHGQGDINADLTASDLPSCEPELEVCDSVDNDLDGETDELILWSASTGQTDAGSLESATATWDPSGEIFTYTATFAHRSGAPVTGFTLAMNDGPNPKGHAELALLYFDGQTDSPVVTAYGYNGRNDFTSYRNGSPTSVPQPADPIASSLVDEGFLLDASIERGDTSSTLSFTIDASALVDHTPSTAAVWDWYGIGLGAEKAGIWTHWFQGLSATYTDGWLASWSFSRQGWLDGVDMPTDTCEPVVLPQD